MDPSSDCQPPRERQHSKEDTDQIILIASQQLPTPTVLHVLPVSSHYGWGQGGKMFAPYWVICWGEPDLQLFVGWCFDLHKCASDA